MYFNAVNCFVKGVSYANIKINFQNIVIKGWPLFVIIKQLDFTKTEIKINWYVLNGNKGMKFKNLIFSIWYNST